MLNSMKVAKGHGDLKKHVMKLIGWAHVELSNRSCLQSSTSFQTSDSRLPQEDPSASSLDAFDGLIVVSRDAGCPNRRKEVDVGTPSVWGIASPMQPQGHKETTGTHLARVWGTTWRRWLTAAETRAHTELTESKIALHEPDRDASEDRETDDCGERCSPFNGEERTGGGRCSGLLILLRRRCQTWESSSIQKKWLG